jgi:WD40 repeat protein
MKTTPALESTASRKSRILRRLCSAIAWAALLCPWIAPKAADVSARLWDAETGKLLHKFKGFNRPTLSLAFFPDGSRIVGGSLTPELRVWNVATGKPMATFQPAFKSPGFGPSMTIAVSADGQRLLVGSTFGDLVLRDANNGALLRVIARKLLALRNAGFSTDGHSVFAVMANPPSFEVWDAQTGAHLHSFGEKSFSPTRDLTLAMDGRSRSSWNTRNGTRLSDGTKRSEGDLRDVDGAGYVPFPDLSKLLVWFPTWEKNKQAARVWEINSGTLVWITNAVFEASTQAVETYSSHQPIELAFSPDGLLLAVANGNGQISLLNARDGSPARTLETGQRCEGVAFSREGTKILSCSFGRKKTVTVWEVNTGKKISAFTSPAITCATFSPDGKMVLTGGDGQFRGL